MPPEGQRGIFKGTTADYAKEANRQTLVCLMLEEVEAIENLPELATVPGNLIPKFLGLGVQYFHSGVNRLLQQSSVAYLETMRQAAAGAGK